MSNNIPRSDPLNPNHIPSVRARGIRGAELHESEVDASYLRGNLLDDSSAPQDGQAYVWSSTASKFLLTSVSIGASSGGVGGSGVAAHNILSTAHLDADSTDTPALNDVLTWTGTSWNASPSSGGGHVIAEDGSALTSRSTLNFVDTDVPVASDNGGTTLASFGSYVVLNGRAVNQTIAGGVASTSTLTIKGGNTGSSGTVLIDNSDLKFNTTGKRIYDNAGSQRMYINNAHPHIFLYGDVYVNGNGGTSGYIQMDEISTPAIPAANTLKLYGKDVSGTTKLFYMDDAGTEIGPLGTGGGGGMSSHSILGTAHSDITVGTVVRGDLITGQGTAPTWTRLALGGANKVLGVSGSDAAWTTVTVNVEKVYVWHLASTTVGVVTGNALGGYRLTNSSGLTETVTDIVITSDATAGTSATVVIEQGDGRDNDSISWATVQSNSVGSGEEGYIKTSAFTDSTLDADRLLRCNVTAVTGTYYNMTVKMIVTIPYTVTLS